MKKINLLAALAVPAMFAACTNEDILNEMQQNVQEVVGAELVGSGISLNVTSGDVLSRVAVDGNGNPTWTKTDRLGLGWLITSDNASSVQDSTKGPKNSKVWANNLFQMEGDENGVFTTKGNIYAGWQFAYFPFEYQNAPGSYKFVNINPVQKTMDLSERYSQNLHISALQFITKEDLDADYQLTKPFALNNVVNTLYMKTKAVEGSAFEVGAKLADAKITSVKINTNKEVFTDSILLKTKEFPVQGSAVLRDAMKDLVQTYKQDKSEGRNTSLTTEIASTLNYKVSNGKGQNRIMPIVLPTYKAEELDTMQVSIEIKAGSGQFTVGYVKGAAEGTPAAKNNEVIEALIGAFGEDSTMVNWTGFVELGEIQLYDSIYTADYTNIMDIEDWEQAVYTADALNEKNPVFNLGEKANVVFSDSLYAPKNGVTVTGVKNGSKAGKLVIDGNFDWLDGISTGTGVEVHVNSGDTLSVEGILSPKKLVNNGVILAGGEATVKATIDNNSFVNNGRVIVEYGAYVYPSATSTGDVAYIVPVDYSYSKINTLIGADTEKYDGYANVNTLIINEGVELDCYVSMKNDDTPADDDRYHSSDLIPGGTTTYGIKLTKDINLEINGGIVSSTEVKTVGNVTISEGGVLEGVNVYGKLNITEGTVSCKTITGDVTAEDATISAETITGNVTLKGESVINNAVITGNVTVNAGAEVTLNNVTINGTLTNKGTVIINSNKSMVITNLVNEGTLTSNNNLNVVNVTLNNCTTTLESATGKRDKMIWYTGEYKFVSQTLNGAVEKFDFNLLENKISSVADGGIVTLEANVNDAITIPEGKKFTLDLNGKTINLTNDAALSGSTGTKSQVLQILKNAEITLKNGTIKSDVAKMLIQNYGTLTLVDMTLVAQEVDGYKSYAISNNNGTVNITGKTNITAPNAFDIYDFNSQGYTGAPTVTVNTTGVINGDIEMGGNATTPAVQLTLKLEKGTINGNLIKNAKYADKITVEKASTGVTLNGTGWE